MNKGMKWGAAVLAAGVLIGNAGVFGGSQVSAAASKPVVKPAAQPGVALKYNGKVLSLQGKLVDGVTMIPVSILRDAAGLPLSYNPGIKTYTVGSGVTKLNLEVSDYGVSAYINGSYVGDNSNSYDGKLIDGKLYVPFKLLNDYMGFQGVYTASSKTLSLSKRQMNQVTISTELIKASDANATILIRYPQLSGLANADAQETINKVFKDKAEAFATEAKAKAKKRDAKVEHPYEFDGTFLVTYNRQGVLSIVTDSYEYTGGAHGMTAREGFTFSLKDGKQLTLDSLLHNSADAKTKLDKLLKQKATKDGFTDGFNGLKKDADFYVKESGLTIFFQQYEIGPYAAGFPTYTFNFSDLLPKGTDPFEAAK
ncbi:PdaC/SigV domain-containing protein [Paenibacillus cellulositrophicus]|uniref:PdaC/SigV domain-containing protein n=1 Tax=Paenibacillus cellulositrophicus TaxID=562959 RepID=UPI00142EA587|nr:DUF4163 domain-containing protein [Paenibacillus cellulositrophicus]